MKSLEGTVFRTENVLWVDFRGVRISGRGWDRGDETCRSTKDLILRVLYPDQKPSNAGPSSARHTAPGTAEA